MSKNGNLKIGTKVKLTKAAREETYEDMDWKNEKLIITHTHRDSEGLGLLYSFDSLESKKEITCSLYGYEIRVIS